MLSTSFFLCLIMAGILVLSGSSYSQPADRANVKGFRQIYSPSEKKHKHPPVCNQRGELLKALAMAVYPYRDKFIFTQSEKIDFDVRSVPEICLVADAFRSRDYINGDTLGSLPTYLVYFLGEDKQSFTTAIVVLDGSYILFENDWSKLYPLSDTGVNILKGRVHPLQSVSKR